MLAVMACAGSLLFLEGRPRPLGVNPMRIIDLSAPIAPSPTDAAPFERVAIHYIPHVEGAAQAQAMLCVPRICCETARAGRSRSSPNSAPTASRTSMPPGITTARFKAGGPPPSTNCH